MEDKDRLASLGYSEKIVDGRRFITRVYEDGTSVSWVPNPLFDGPLPNGEYGNLIKIKARRKGFSGLGPLTFKETIWRQFIAWLRQKRFLRW